MLTPCKCEELDFRESKLEQGPTFAILAGVDFVHCFTDAESIPCLFLRCPALFRWSAPSPLKTERNKKSGKCPAPRDRSTLPGESYPSSLNTHWTTLFTYFHHSLLWIYGPKSSSTFSPELPTFSPWLVFQLSPFSSSE